MIDVIFVNVVYICICAHMVLLGFIVMFNLAGHHITSFLVC